MKGRPVRGVIGGLILGILIAIDLVFLGAIKANSVWVTILPLALMVVGLGLGLWAPLGRGNSGRGNPSIAESTPPI